MPVEEKKVKILVVEGKEFTLDDIEVYLKTCVDTKRVKVTREDIEVFFAYCKAKGLNPWDVHFIKYKDEDKPVIVVSIHALLKRTEATGKLKGLEAGVIVQKDGKEIEFRKGSLGLPGEALVGGWAKVWKEGVEKPFETAVSMSEYRRDNMPNWKKMPATMIRKVALAHCLREAFPNELAGIYATEEEWKQEHSSNGRESALAEEAEKTEGEAKEEKPQKVEAKTLKELKLLAKKFYEIKKKGDAGYEKFIADLKERYGVLAPEALSQEEAQDFISYIKGKRQQTLQEISLL